MPLFMTRSHTNHLILQRNTLERAKHLLEYEYTLVEARFLLLEAWMGSIYSPNGLNSRWPKSRKYAHSTSRCADH
jgi:hypothetical protein